MGHNTDYTGEIQIISPLPLTVEMLTRLNALLDLTPVDKSEIATDPPEYPALKLTKDLTALKWTGAKKTYGMAKVLNWLTTEMIKVFPGFMFSGGLSWTDEYGDAGVVRIDAETGMAEEVVIDPLEAVKAAEGLEKYKVAWEAFAAALDGGKDWEDMEAVYEKLCKTLK